MTIKVGEVVEWEVLSEKRGEVQFATRLLGVVSWVDKGSLATPEPMAVIKVKTRFAFAYGHEELGRFLPVSRDDLIAASTEILEGPDQSGFDNHCQ